MDACVNILNFNFEVRITSRVNVLTLYVFTNVCMYASKVAEILPASFHFLSRL